MTTPYRLRQTLGPDYDADPEDVWATKQTLRLNGYYAEPDYGMTVYPDRQMFESIKRYQRDNRLRVDGIMKPDGETEHHFLTRNEIAQTYWCRVCGAPHGGVYSPKVCWQCWNKGYR